MSSSSKVIILTLIFVFHFAHGANQIQCDPNNRPSDLNCTDTDNSFVCAYYTENCPFSICSITEASPCFACSTYNILYYEPGECNSTQEVNNCTFNICNSIMNPGFFMLENYYNPACGIQKTCDGSKKCQKTYNNVCKACAAESSVYYQDGPCEPDKNYCNATRPTTCSDQIEEVCAFFHASGGAIHYANVSNSCTACQSDAVDYYLKGACGNPLQNQTFCLPNSSIFYCPFEDAPVCGFYLNSDNTYSYKVLPNACQACNDKTIVYHTPGPCIFYCERNVFIAVHCEGNLQPICAQVSENGAIKNVSLRNACIGCYDSSLQVDTYFNGLCPGDDGILCVNNGEGQMEGSLNPICGLTKLDCNDSSCRKTYADPYTACTNTTIVKYLIGSCPGDEGVPCTGFRDGPNKLDFTYDNVCGYTERNCNCSSCRANYADQWKACKNSKVLFFKAGPC